MLGQSDPIDAADDVEAIRVALGEPKMTFLGLSYGTELGAVYASRYPDRVRTMVLDGAVHHARPLRQAVIEETAAGDDALRRFAAWCDDRPPRARRRRCPSPRRSTARCC